MNSKISLVSYDEINKEGISKKEDEDYAKLMKIKSNITPKEALEKQLIDKQDIDKIDSITGATVTSKHFYNLVKDALNKGK